MINYLDDDEITQQLMWYMRAAQLVDLYDDSCLPIVSDMLENITQMSLTEWAEYSSGIVGGANGLEEGVVEKNEVDTQLMVFLDNEDDEEDQEEIVKGRAHTANIGKKRKRIKNKLFPIISPHTLKICLCISSLHIKWPQVFQNQNQLYSARAGASSDVSSRVKNSKIDSRLKHQLCLARAGASSDGETTRPSRCVPRIDSKPIPELSKLDQISRIDSRLKHQLCLARAGASSNGETTRPSRRVPRIDSKPIPELSKLNRNSRIDSRLKHQL
ncbi:hypothetical protein BDR26DRAFT_899432 [Obelidium mucronatum]|nr:hypothetical protein BDR26DRAFT_899432 [Obelidium mucronatum]